MEIEGGLYSGKVSEKCANVPSKIISLDALAELEMFAKINSTKQGKAYSK